MTQARIRRSTSEIRALMLSAARDLFAANGYAGTSTRAISQQARVSEALLFSHFGTKEQLFEAAVIEPIDGFLRQYTEGWLAEPAADGDPEAEIRGFVEGLYDLIREHRNLLLAASPTRLGDGAQLALGRLEHMATEVAQGQGYAFEPAISIRAAVSMVTCMALFDEPLFGKARTPDRDALVNELTALLQRGLMRRS